MCVLLYICVRIDSVDSTLEKVYIMRTFDDVLQEVFKKKEKKRKKGDLPE